MPPSSRKKASRRQSRPTAPRGSARESFREGLQKLCSKFHLTLSELTDFHTNQLRIEFAPHFPMWIRIDVEENSKAAVLVGAVRTVGLPGDRSDYHDLISLLWAA